MELGLLLSFVVLINLLMISAQKSETYFGHSVRKEFMLACIQSLEQFFSKLVLNLDMIELYSLISVRTSEGDYCKEVLEVWQIWIASALAVLVLLSKSLFIHEVVAWNDEFDCLWTELF